MIDLLIDDQYKNTIRFAIIKRDHPEGQWTHVLDKKTWKKREGFGLIDATGGPTFSIEKDHIEDLSAAFAKCSKKLEDLK